MFASPNKNMPWSLLPDKMLRITFYLNLSKCLEVNKLLSNNQSGFRKGHPTMGTVAEITDGTLPAMNDNLPTITPS